MLPPEFGVDGADEERHVIRDDVDDAASGFISDLDGCGFGCAVAGNLPVVVGTRSEHIDVVALSVFARQMLIVVSDERFEFAV